MTVDVSTTVKLTYNNLVMMPLVVEIYKEAAEWSCQFGHRLYSGTGTDPKLIVLEILDSMAYEISEAMRTAKSI